MPSRLPRTDSRPLSPAPRRLRAALAGLALLPLLAGCMSRSDALAPVVSITEPKSGAVRTADRLEVRGYAMDDEGIRAIRVDGSDLLQSETYRDERGKRLILFRFGIQGLTEGERVTRIEVEDRHGRTSRLDFGLRIDTTPPTVELEATPLADGRLRVTGTARDNTSVTSVVIADAPMQFIAGPEVPFSIDVAAGEGAAIVVTDSAGNRISRALR